MTDHMNRWYLYSVSFIGMCQSFHSALYHVHPIVHHIFSIDPYINIARHMSVLTIIYHMREISIKKINFISDQQMVM